MRPMPVTMPAAGTAPSYISYAAKAESSRKGEPGSSNTRMRSRASNLPGPRGRCREGSSPPRAIACDLSRRSATTARIAWSLARNASERRSIEEGIAGIARPQCKDCTGPGKDSVLRRKRRVRVSYPQPPGLPGRHREDGLSGERVERRLAAILAADVAGYSRLMGRDDAGSQCRHTELRRTIITPT